MADTKPLPPRLSVAQEGDIAPDGCWWCRVLPGQEHLAACDRAMRAKPDDPVALVQRLAAGLNDVKEQILTERWSSTPLNSPDFEAGILEAAVVVLDGLYGVSDEESRRRTNKRLLQALQPVGEPATPPPALPTECDCAATGAPSETHYTTCSEGSPFTAVCRDAMALLAQHARRTEIDDAGSHSPKGVD